MFVSFLPEPSHLLRPIMAWQSDTHSSGFPLNAIDGNTDGHYTKGSCSYTGHVTEPWFMLDLAAQYDVVAVELFNRYFQGNTLKIFNS